ncbi:uncharacterized protein LOC143288436 [Babylonia areolata]|uniref:uncharacterized protein LOC143288436 n=1 Tax=Babylonia areolata TaxID=304850 RepID=UPI003FD599EC
MTSATTIFTTTTTESAMTSSDDEVTSATTNFSHKTTALSPPAEVTLYNTTDVAPTTAGAVFYMALGMCLGAWGFALFIIGGNLLIVSAVVRVRKLRTLSNMYIVSLAVADSLVGVILLPLGISFLPSFAHLFRDSYLGCMTFLGLIYVTVSCSGGHMFLVSVDRYLFLIHPYLYSRVFTERRVMVSILVVWCLSILYGSGVFVFNHYDSVRNCNGPEVLPASFNVYSSGSLHFLLMLITAYVYFRIMLLAFQKQRAMSKDRGRQRRARSKCQRKLVDIQKEKPTKSTSAVSSLITSQTLIHDIPDPVETVLHSSVINNSVDDKQSALYKTEEGSDKAGRKSISSISVHYAASPVVSSAVESVTGVQARSGPGSISSKAVVEALQISALEDGPSPCLSGKSCAGPDTSSGLAGGPDVMDGSAEHPDVGRAVTRCAVNGSAGQQAGSAPDSSAGSKVPQVSPITSPCVEPHPSTTITLSTCPSDQGLRVRTDVPSASSCPLNASGQPSLSKPIELATECSPAFSHSSSGIPGTATTAVLEESNEPGLSASNGIRQNQVSTMRPEISSPSEGVSSADPAPTSHAPPRSGEPRSSPWKAVRLFVIVFVSFSAFWLPYYICLFVRTSFNIQQAVLDVLVLLGILNSGVNFIVYAMISRDFRAYFKRRLCLSRCSNDVLPVCGFKN